MRMHVVGLMMGSLLAVTGCASQQHAQALKQLESDLGLLDQRVTQLERAGLATGSPANATSTAWSGETASATAAVTPVESVVPLAAPRSLPSVKPTKTEIQQALKNAGFYQGPVDGKIGPQTREAIRSFQQVNGLKVDGVVGKVTWSKLSAYLDLNASHNSELGAAETLK